MLSIAEILKSSNGKLINGDINKEVPRYIMDSRESSKDDFFIPIVGENVNAHDYIFSCVEKDIMGFFINVNQVNKNNIIKSSIEYNPNICIIEVDDTKKALFNIGMYNRKKHINIPIIAVTGSVGKTSTREIIASVIKTEKNALVTQKNFNSDIGLPFMLLKLENQDICVLEVGISDIGEMTELSKACVPDVAVITNIGMSHVGIMGSQYNIFQEKLKICDYMKEDGILLLNGDDEYLKTVNKSNVYKYSINDVKNIETSGNVTNFEVQIYEKQEKIEIDAVGNHNIYNVLCAIKLGQLYNIKVSNIIKGIKSYKSFARRMEQIELKNGCVVIDDAYNSSFDSIQAGLSSVVNMDTNKKKIVVIGDILEQGEYAKQVHSEVGRLFAKYKVDFLYTIGEYSKYVSDEAIHYLGEEKVKHFDKKSEFLNIIDDIIDENNIIYFKASNGIKFDEFIEHIKKKYN